MIATSKRLIKDLWQRAPDQLGPGSKLFQKAETNWLKTRSYSFPENRDLNQKFVEANCLAWWALWRAYDFSFDGIKAREGLGNDFQQGPWLNQTKVDGVVFSLVHEPVIDSQSVPRKQSNPKFFKSFMGSGDSRFSRYLDGMIITEDPNRSTLESEASKSSYCYIYSERTLTFNNIGCERSWLEGVNLGNNPESILHDCFVKGSVKKAANAVILRGLDMSQFNGIRVSDSIDLQGCNISTGASWPSDIRVWSQFSIPVPNGPVLFDSGTPYVTFTSGNKNGSLSLSGQCESIEFRGLGENFRLKLKEVQADSINITASGTGCEYDFRDVKTHGSFRIDGCEPKKIVLLDCDLQSSEGVALDLEGIQKVEFIDRVYFRDCKFRGGVSLSAIRLNSFYAERTTFGGKLDLRNTTIRHSLTLSPSSRENVFKYDVDVSSRQSQSVESRSLGRLELEGTIIPGEIDFSNRIMDDQAVFDNSTFHAVPKFFGTQVSQDTSFRNVTILWENASAMKFRPWMQFSAIFRETRTPEFKWAALRGAISRWKNQKQWGLSERKNPDPFERYSIGLAARGNRILATAISILDLVFRPQRRLSTSSDLRDRNSYLGETERSLRILRQRMEEIKATSLAERFGREEMRARHLRYGDGAISVWEYYLGNMYWKVSRYGDSLARPIVTLLVSLAVMSVVYAAMLGKAGGLWFGFLVALNVTLRPMFQLGPSYGREGTAYHNGCEAINFKAATEAKAGSFEVIQYLTNCQEVGFKLLSFGHSLLVIVLLFLAVLAIRRKLKLG